MRQTLIRRLINLTVVLVLLSLPTVAMATQSQTGTQFANADTVVVPAGSPVQIAVAMWTGFPTSQDTFDAVQMAFDDYGQIKGFSTHRNDYDPGCDEPTGAAAGTAIVAEDQNVGVIGPFCSSSTHGMAPVLESGFAICPNPCT